MATTGKETFIPRPLTREQVRDVDRRAIDDYGMVGLVLMENAGRNSAELLRTLNIHGRVTICCGKGNNGGDGFVIARHLENAGVDVRVLLCVPPASLTGDAKSNLNIIVDALLGTGTQGTIREPFVSAITAINSSGCKVYAIDLPSGLDCDTGQPLGVCVRANHTATFVARKIGFDIPGSAEWTGTVHVIDIGVPRSLLENL